MNFKDFFNFKSKPKPPAETKPETKPEVKPEFDYSDLFQVKPKPVEKLPEKINLNTSRIEVEKQAWPHFAKGFEEFGRNWLKVSGLKFGAESSQNLMFIKRGSKEARDYEIIYPAFYKGVQEVIKTRRPLLALGNSLEDAVKKNVNNIAQRIGLFDK